MSIHGVQRIFHDYSAFVQNSISGPCLAHVPHLGGGVGFQIVVLHRMIENGAQLIVERFQIHGGVRLPFCPGSSGHFTLPRHDLLNEFRLIFRFPK